MTMIERAMLAGFKQTLAKVAGISMPDGPEHLQVEQLSKMLRSGQIENELSQTVNRSRSVSPGKPVTWGPKSSLAGQNNGQADRGMSDGGMV